MGYSIRVVQPVNARYTEWVLMSYGNSTSGRAGAHMPQESPLCPRAHIYDDMDSAHSGVTAGNSSMWHTGAEVVNVADDPAYAALAETLRAYLCRRLALGQGGSAGHQLRSSRPCRG